MNENLKDFIDACFPHLEDDIREMAKQNSPENEN